MTYFARELLDFLREDLKLSVESNTLYVAAFTHGSTGKAKDYQRLEFLGDRVLALAVTEILYFAFPDEPEGALSVRLNRLVSRKNCAAIARTLNLGQHIQLGKQARDDGARDSDNILGDVMEALLGALYLEKGYAETAKFIAAHWSDSIRSDTGPNKHPKSELQEWAAQHRKGTPDYQLVDRSGPHHASEFRVQVTIRSVGHAEAVGSSKQEAETAAAKAFLAKFGNSQ